MENSFFALTLTLTIVAGILAFMFGSVFFYHCGKKNKPDDAVLGIGVGVVALFIFFIAIAGQTFDHSAGKLIYGLGNNAKYETISIWSASFPDGVPSYANGVFSEDFRVLHLKQLGNGKDFWYKVERSKFKDNKFPDFSAKFTVVNDNDHIIIVPITNEPQKTKN